jgi:hypothetical protein
VKASRDKAITLTVANHCNLLTYKFGKNNYRDAIVGGKTFITQAKDENIRTLQRRMVVAQGITSYIWLMAFIKFVPLKYYGRFNRYIKGAVCLGFYLTAEPVVACSTFLPVAYDYYSSIKDDYSY